MLLQWKHAIPAVSCDSWEGAGLILAMVSSACFVGESPAPRTRRMSLTLRGMLAIEDRAAAQLEFAKRGVDAYN